MYRAPSAIAFKECVKHLSNFRLTCQLGLSDQAQEQNRNVFLATELVDNLQRILKDFIRHYKISNVITDVCHKYEALRVCRRQALQSTNDKAIERGLENKYRAMWNTFLEEKRKNNPACRLFNTRIENMPTGRSATDHLHQNVVDFHCLRSKRFVQAVTRNATARSTARI